MAGPVVEVEMSQYCGGAARVWMVEGGTAVVAASSTFNAMGRKVMSVAGFACATPPQEGII